MNRVRLTQEEAQWFGRNILKSLEIFEARAKKNPQVLEKRTYRGFKSMKEKAEKAKDLTEKSIDIILSQKQKLIVRELIGTVLNGLITKTIPSYEARTDLDPKYIANAKAKAAQLSLMHRKFS